METEFNEFEQALDAVAELLAHLKKQNKGISLPQSALDLLDKAGAGPIEMVSTDPIPIQPPPRSTGKSPVAAATDEPTPALKELLDIRNWIGDCGRCGLHEKRTKIVFGDGNPNADLMFIGEGPGRDEDLQGLPFIGAAGKLLTSMIEGGLKKSRSDVYITNIVKCRPPGNRDPLPDETCVCKRFLVEQIRLIQPKVICALGRIAAQNLLEVRTPISKMRGNWFEFMGIKVMPTFHPAALLRNPASKRPTWQDLQMIMAELKWDQ